ncbi:hypothetical protein C4K08_3238 [Pseudomonas chlororaphis subsp. aureofaciens]|nr:hypothetical protein C4K08_3238 [Pseudomonas chlororaphis subsp. aureofaciens]
MFLLSQVQSSIHLYHLISKLNDGQWSNRT